MLATYALQLRVALVLPSAPLALAPPLLGGGRTIACATRQTNEEEQDTMTILYTQPYDTSATGFYFDS